MRKLSVVALLLLPAGLACAETTFDIGGKPLQIPPPAGYAAVTEKMSMVHRLSQQMVDPMNDQLAFYIPEASVPEAEAGQMPGLERYFILKVNKRLKTLTVSTKDFAEIKTVMKRENQELIKSLEKKMPGMMEKISKGISKEFDADVVLQLSQMVPLASHHDTDNTFAFSMYAKYGSTVDGQKTDFVVAATSTMVNVSGRIVFLYCYGAQPDLEWTRSASQAWADAVAAGNAPPPAKSSKGSGFGGSGILRGAVIGAIVGGVVALILGLIRKKKKT